MGEVIFRFPKLWQLRQLSKLQSWLTLVVLPQKKAVSPLLGGSKRYSLVCALCTCVKVVLCWERQSRAFHQWW